jgi:N-acyl-D-amino-acid deacylase
VLGHYSRDVGLFSLETAVWKMSGLTAKNFGLANRGTIAAGHHADVVVFDATTVIDKATYDTPMEPAEGIETVIVNGALTWHQGAHRGARHGQVITRKVITRMGQTSPHKRALEIGTAERAPQTDRN